MSKLFYRFASLVKYLKYKKNIDENYETELYKTEQDSIIIEEYKKVLQCFESDDDMFKDVYVSYAEEYETELVDKKKREKASLAKTILIREYCSNYGADAMPSDKFIYENVKLPDDLKPFMNLATPFK